MLLFVSLLLAILRPVPTDAESAAEINRNFYSNESCAPFLRLIWQNGWNDSTSFIAESDTDVDQVSGFCLPNKLVHCSAIATNRIKSKEATPWMHRRQYQLHPPNRHCRRIGRNLCQHGRETQGPPSSPTPRESSPTRDAHLTGMECSGTWHGEEFRIVNVEQFLVWVKKTAITIHM